VRLVLHYVSAFVGGFLAMSAHIYLYFGSGNWLAPQRLSVTIGNALIFAHLVALMVIVARDLFPEKRVSRIVIGLIGGTFFGALSWYAHLFLYLYQKTPDLLTLLAGGFGLSIGFLIAGQLNVQNRWLKTFLASVITAIAIYIPIYFAHQAHATDVSAQALLYFQADNPRDVFLIGLPFTISIAIFGNLPLLLQQELT